MKLGKFQKKIAKALKIQKHSPALAVYYYWTVYKGVLGIRLSLSHIFLVLCLDVPPWIGKDDKALFFFSKFFV